MEPTLVTETPEVLALNKPAGLIVHRDGRTEERSVAEWLLACYPALASVCPPWISPQGEAVPLAGLVHRLDRGTSGILLAAKTPEAYAYIKEEFKARRVEKRYLAYVHGRMEGEAGRIVAEIARTSTPPRRWYARECAEGDTRAAITEWRVVRELEGATFLELAPRTGRTHQLRVHLAHIGHPILGDHLYTAQCHPDILQNYGMSAALGFARPALHAARITLALPSGERATFEAPLPSDFQRAALVR